MFKSCKCAQPTHPIDMGFSHAISKPFNFIQTEIHIFQGNLWRQNNQAEKVDFVFQRLISDHHAAFFHHALFDEWSHLGTDKDKGKELTAVTKWPIQTSSLKTHFGQFFLVIWISFLPSQTGWYEPEADIQKLWLATEKNRQIF